MACFLGLPGHTHAHATRLMADTGLQAPVTDTVLLAAQPEEACAICLWKAQTPYVPALEAPLAVCAFQQAEVPSLPSRAPPAAAPASYRNRAPPTLLS